MVHRPTAGEHAENLRSHFRRHVGFHGFTSNERKRPPSTAKLRHGCHLMQGGRGADGAGGLEWVDERQWGPAPTNPLEQPRRICPFALDGRREVAEPFSIVNPGRTLLMVMHGANSLDMDSAHEAMAPRRVFERPMLGMGSLTEVEMIWTIFRSLRSPCPGQLP